MKYFLILTLGLFLTACDSEDSPDCDLNCDIIGEWEWTRTYGSIAGGIWTPQNTGDIKKIEIDEDQIYFFENGSLLEQYTYEFFESDTIIRDNVLRTFIKYNKNTRILKLDGDNLEMNDLCFDCYDDYYIKK